jgi:hypothetical protein
MDDGTKNSSRAKKDRNEMNRKKRLQSIEQATSKPSVGSSFFGPAKRRSPTGVNLG